MTAVVFILVGLTLEIGMVVYANRIESLYDDDEENDDNDKPKVDSNKNELNQSTKDSTNTKQSIELKSFVTLDQESTAM